MKGRIFGEISPKFRVLGMGLSRDPNPLWPDPDSDPYNATKPGPAGVTIQRLFTA